MNTPIDYKQLLKMYMRNVLNGDHIEAAKAVEKGGYIEPEEWRQEAIKLLLEVDRENAGEYGGCLAYDGWVLK